MTWALPAFPPPPADAGVFQPYWDAVGRGRLALPRCADCGSWAWYPPARCRRCHGRTLRWEEVEGTGAVFTYTVAHRAFLPGVRLDAPYVVALVELDAAPGPRLVADLVGCAPDRVRIGMRVRVRFVEAGGLTVPVFEPAGETA